MPSKPYYVDGKRVPSVTTISGRFGNKDGIIWWANAVGRGERDCDDQEVCRHCGRKAGKQTYEAKGAAEVGTYAHALIDQQVKGTEVDPLKFDHLTVVQHEQARQCMEGFNEWYNNFNVAISETELPLLSEELKFGGTFDAVGIVGDKFCLIDWKTSKGIYPDYLCQMGGYIVRLEENEYPRVEAIHLLRVSKETAGFHHHQFPRRTFEPAIVHFKLARELYALDKTVEKILK